MKSHQSSQILHAKTLEEAIEKYPQDAARELERLNFEEKMVDFVADFLQNWLEDNVNPNLYEEMIKTVENLSTKKEFDEVSVKLFNDYVNTRLTSFEEQLTKLETIEE